MSYHFTTKQNKKSVSNYSVSKPLKSVTVNKVSCKTGSI